MTTAADRPNVLILHADQHRWDCLGCTGNADVQTPNVDRLAADGARYENSFCPLPICTPSRYSLLTGLYVRQHLGWTNHCTIPPALPTWPKALREAGYATAAVGKMHFTPTYLDVGFDRMLLAEQDGPGRFDDDYHRYLRDRGLVDRIDLMDQRQEYRRNAPAEYWPTFGAAESDLPEEHHSTTWIGDRAAEVMDGWSAGGHCLMVGFIKPHHPFDPPAPWSRMYDPGELTLLPGWAERTAEEDIAFHTGYFPNAELTEPTIRRIMAMYYATISQIDHQVGRLLRLLDERGLYDNTLIVYTSDHGDYMGFRHQVLKGGVMYDPLVKVPLVVKHPHAGAAGGRPAAPPPGTASDALVSNLDVGTTILAACGIEAPETMTGLDLAANPGGREAIFCEGWAGRQNMVRTRDRKLLLFRQGRHDRFYDLAADPLEGENLIADPARADEIDALRERLFQWALRDALPPRYLDCNAPHAPGENALGPDLSHREDLAGWMRQQMAAHADTDADLFR